MSDDARKSISAGNTGTAKFIQERETNVDCLGAKGCNIDARDGRRSNSLRQHQSNTLQSDGKPDGRHGRAPKLFNQSVITPTGSDGILRAEMGTGHLKGGEAIIIEAADKPMVHVRGISTASNPAMTPVEMITRCR